jgi:hypothetical protein
LPLGVENQRHSHTSTKQSSAARALNGKQLRGLGAFTWKLFRYVSSNLLFASDEVQVKPHEVRYCRKKVCWITGLKHDLDSVAIVLMLRLVWFLQAKKYNSLQSSLGG